MCWKPTGKTTVQDIIDKTIKTITNGPLDMICGTHISVTNDGNCPYSPLTVADSISTPSDLTIDFDTISTVKIKCEGHTYTLNKNQLIYFILQLFEEKK